MAGDSFKGPLPFGVLPEGSSGELSVLVCELLLEVLNFPESSRRCWVTLFVCALCYAYTVHVHMLKHMNTDMYAYTCRQQQGIGAWQTCSAFPARAQVVLAGGAASLQLSPQGQLRSPGKAMSRELSLQAQLSGGGSPTWTPWV